MNSLHFIFPLLITGIFATPVKYDQRQEGELNFRADLQNFVIIALVPKVDGAAAGSYLLNAISKTLPQRKSDNLAIRRHSKGSDGDLAVTRDEPFTDKKNTPYHVDITKGKIADENKSNAKTSQSGRKSSGIIYKVTKLKLPGSTVEIPVPDVSPVKNNKQVSSGRKNGRRSMEFNNDIAESESDDTIGTSLEEENDDAPEPPTGVQYWLLGSRNNCGPGFYRDDTLLCVPCPQGKVTDYETGICKD